MASRFAEATAVLVGAGDQRDEAGDLRDEAGDQRDEAGDERDQAGDQRDQDADQRDHDADRRDRAGARRDHDADRRDRSEALAAGGNVTEASSRSALKRQEAAADRRMALHDRQAAAQERTHAELDRSTAMADRTAGACGRDSSELDRGTAMADRAAAARDRLYGSQLATSLQFGWIVRSLDPAEFLYVSPGYLKIMGLDPGRAGLTLADAIGMIHPDDAASVAAQYWSPLAGSASVEGELRIIRPDGGIRWVRTTSNPVLNPDGTVTRTAATVEDVTDRKTGEAAVLTSQREAERANAAKSEFLSRVSHELRTPLNAVLGFAQLLELDVLTESQSKAVDQILRGGRHLLDLINDVLDISAIESDQLELSTEPVLAADVLTQTIALMRPVAAAGSVEIRYAPANPGGGEHVLADCRRLRQVLLNLLSNAIKFNRRGGRIEVNYQLHEAASLRLSVRDTGLGVRADDLPRLFTMFDRLGQQSADIEGTGIGLALSKRLIELMGGRLDVESVVGEGSTFSVILPLCEAPDKWSADSHDAAARIVNIPVDRSTILYIEDNVSNVALLESILNLRPNWTLLHAGHGTLGLELARTSRPSLILLDLHLPDMHGIDVLRALRADPLTAAIPVIVVSADVNPLEVRRLNAAGAQHYMTKPVNVNDVLGLLDLHCP